MEYFGACETSVGGVQRGGRGCAALQDEWSEVDVQRSKLAGDSRELVFSLRRAP